MDVGTLLVDVWIALVIAAVVVAVIRAWQARMPRLAPLPTDSRNQYLHAWEQVAKRFVDAPQQAVREADVIVTSLLRERGHPLNHERLPSPLLDARRNRIKGEERGDTEVLRKSLVDYRAVFDKMIGQAPRQEASGRRELA